MFMQVQSTKKSFSMHDTAFHAAITFVKLYGSPGATVVDIGGLAVNGSIRKEIEKLGFVYICVDMVVGEGVDIVMKPGDKMPFSVGSVDLIISTSCFEHDPLFWMTFKEMCKIIKMGGHIYINAPSNGKYHGYPGDNWRFYSDAGQALAYWSGKQISTEDIHHVKVVETFHIYPKNDVWIDFVCVWVRDETSETEIVVSKLGKTGGLFNILNHHGFDCKTELKYDYVINNRFYFGHDDPSNTVESYLRVYTKKA